LPEKARSEFVAPRNFADGCVFDTTLMFQVASAASIKPARRPTRGSGVGAAVDMLLIGDGLLVVAEGEVAHAPSDASPRVSVSFNNVAGRDIGTIEDRVITAGIFRA
jgi:hypothetical protein